MRITALVENTARKGFTAKHGLSFYVETKKHKLLFDLGPDNTLLENAKRSGTDIAEVDTVIISHGHSDHGGALEKFLAVNKKARVYVQRRAFEAHYNKMLFLKIPIGIDRSFLEHPQIIAVEGDYEIDDELKLFVAEGLDKCHSPVNDVLLDEKGRDTFSHEQNLLINESAAALIMGCGHAGIVNIMEKAEKYAPAFCVGGFHLFNPFTQKTVSPVLLDEIAGELKKYKDTEFYTCHCTGMRAFRYLAERLPNLSYMACGDTLTI